MKKSTAIGSALVAIGDLHALIGRTELSIICPFGGETPNVANYCLSQENYYLALSFTGLASVVVGFGIVIVGSSSLLKRSKKIVDSQIPKDHQKGKQSKHDPKFGGLGENESKPIRELWI